MNDEQTPDVEEIKVRLGDEIPVEEEPGVYKAEKEQRDVADELRNLGRQFGETIRAAWYSEERKEFEREVKEGLDSFASEVDKAFREIKSTTAAQRAQEEAEEIKIKIDEADLTDKTKSSLATGLSRLSQELGKLAESFTPSEKAPPGDESAE